MRLTASCLTLGLSLAWASAALASPAQLELSLNGCSELSESALREHLSIELATLGLEHAETHLSLSCEQGAVAIELYRQDGTRYPVGSRVELRDTARAARERLIALAASELRAQADREEREAPRPSPTAPPSSPPSRDTAPSPSPRAPAPAARRPVELSLAGTGARSGSPGAWLWGGVLGARFGLGGAWSVAVDTQFARGSERLSLAEVRWTLLGGYAGAAVGAELGPLRGSAGLGMRAGWLTLSADASSPNSGRSLTAAWAGAALPLRVALATGGAVWPFAGAELGYVVLPVRGRASDGRLLVEQRGAWLGASLGLSVEL